MSEIRTIGISTGGGDAPGLNAVIRAVVKSAFLKYHWKVIGIPDGFDGLINPENAFELTLKHVSGILPRGGTVLGTTNRGNPFVYKATEDGKEVTKDVSADVIANARKLGIDAVVVIGGDGSQKIALELAEKGLKVVGVPKTIDNDLSATDITFGFDTALSTATDAVDKIHTTAESHHRIMLVEVMGRDAGWIALGAGVAGGAHVILIPEIAFSVEKIAEYVRRRESYRKMFTIVVVTVLGHIQRGGTPSAFDRILATRFGVAAVDMIARGEFGRMVCLHQSKVGSVPIAEAIGHLKCVDPNGELVHVARSIGICFGD